MSLQFADFNADGHQDIVTATWEGTVFLVAGSESGWQQPAYIRDAKEQLILLSRYYDVQAKKYDNADCALTGAADPKDHLISAFAWDWDNDGNYDTPWSTTKTISHKFTLPPGQSQSTIFVKVEVTDGAGGLHTEIGSLTVLRHQKSFYIIKGKNNTAIINLD